MVVTADASGSTDTDAAPIATYSFDFGDGTSDRARRAARPPRTPTPSPGVTSSPLTVTDTAGKAGTATAVETVSSADGSPVASLSLSTAVGDRHRSR